MSGVLLVFEVMSNGGINSKLTTWKLTLKCCVHVGACFAVVTS